MMNAEYGMQVYWSRIRWASDVRTPRRNRGWLALRGRSGKRYAIGLKEEFCCQGISDIDTALGKPDRIRPHLDQSGRCKSGDLIGKIFPRIMTGLGGEFVKIDPARKSQHQHGQYAGA